MKNKMKQCGIIALVVLPLLLAACDTYSGSSRNSGSAGPSGPSEQSEPTVITGKVYTQAGGTTYEEYDGNLTITSPDYVSGNIVNGILSLTLGDPPLQDLSAALKTSLKNLRAFVSYNEAIAEYESITIHPDTTGAVIERFTVTGDDDDDYGWEEVRKRSTGYGENDTWISEAVMHVFVTQDVTVTGTGKTVSITDTGDSCRDLTLTDFSLSLKKGWNEVHIKQTTSSADDDDYPYAYNAVETVTLGSPPNIMWVLWWDK